MRLKIFVLGITILLSSCAGQKIVNLSILPRPNPKEVPETVLPNYDIYHIRTRIVIESIDVELDDVGKATLFATQYEDLMADLKLTENIFSDIPLKLVVEEMVYMQYKPNHNRFYLDAMLHPNCLSIYYMLPNDFHKDIVGLSSSPWEPITTGILMTSGRSRSTLAHEVGHYFGLNHTFAYDYCSDTPTQTEKPCQAKCADETINCRNIMNYCPHYPKYITKQQLERVRRFLRSSRKLHIIKKYEEIKKIRKELVDSILKKPDDVVFLNPTTQPTTQPSEDVRTK